MTDNNTTVDENLRDAWHQHIQKKYNNKTEKVEEKKSELNVKAEQIKAKLKELENDNSYFATKKKERLNKTLNDLQSKSANYDIDLDRYNTILNKEDSRNNALHIMEAVDKVNAECDTILDEADNALNLPDDFTSTESPKETQLRTIMNGEYGRIINHYIYNKPGVMSESVDIAAESPEGKAILTKLSGLLKEDCLNMTKINDCKYKLKKIIKYYSD